MSCDHSFPQLCSDHGGEGPTVFDLPVPLGLREEWRQLETRRRFLGRAGKVLGWAALGSLLGSKRMSAATGESKVAPAPGAFMRLPNFAPKAKRCIYLFMGGGPPQLDLWDYKPGLVFDQDLPDSVRGSQVLTGMTAGQTRFPVAPTPWKFSRQGKSQILISELLPWTGKVIDEMTVINSLHTDAINHEPAGLLMCTGDMVPGKPSLGAWLAYGLGSMNENLPAFVVLNSKLVKGVPSFPLTPRLWGSGFLSSQYTGVTFRTEGESVLYLNDPAGMKRDARQALVKAVNAINQLTHD